jgi:hypothetical protein
LHHAYKVTKTRWDEICYRIVGEALEVTEMSSIEILIRGDESEAFAQRLLTIEGINISKRGS